MTLLFDPTGTSTSNLVTGEVHTPIVEPDIFPTQGPFYLGSFVVTGTAAGTGAVSTLQLYVDYTLSPLFSIRSEQVSQEVYSYILLTNWAAWSSISLTYQGVGGGTDDILLAQITNAGNFDRTQIANWLNFPGDNVSLTNTCVDYNLTNSGVAYLFANKLDSIAGALGTPSTYLSFISGQFATALANITAIQAQIQSWTTIFTQNGVLVGNLVTISTLANTLLGYASAAQGAISDAVANANGILKSNGSATVVAATPDVDYTTPGTLATSISAAVAAANAYANSISVTLFNTRGGYDASVNTFPTTGSGSGGTVEKGDQWFVTVPGTLGGQAVTIGTSIYALGNTPGQTLANWGIVPSGYGFTPENQANKSTSASVSTDYTGTISDTKYPSIKSIYTWILSAFQTSSVYSAYATGTSDAIIGAVIPAITSLSNGLELSIRSSAANLTTTPTFTPNNGAIGPVTIVKGSGIPLLIGDIPSAGYWMNLKYDATTSKWILLNPANGVLSSETAGFVKSYTGLVAPQGYLACPVAPATLSRTSYPALFNAIVIQNTVTISIGVGTVTWNAHPFINGMVVRLYTTGALPSGVTIGTGYYVVNATTNTFQLSITAGGAPIVTAGTQSGVQTAEYAPWGAGDGSTTFGIPWFPVGYVPIAGSALTIGIQTVGQVINHTHTYNQPLVNSGQYGPNACDISSNIANTGNPNNGGPANLAAGAGVLICVKY